MAKRYSKTAITQVINAWFALLTRHGRGKAYRHILTIRGRKTGRTYSTPVDVMTVEGARYLVAAYGEVSWVKNARAFGKAELSRGGRSEPVHLRELAPADSVPVLRTYYREVPVTHPYFETSDSSSDREFEAEARRHAVFAVVA
jgi:deazaflavin-dependent oxidoreductase (nitroreductase family)